MIEDKDLLISINEKLKAQEDLIREILENLNLINKNINNIHKILNKNNQKLNNHDKRFKTIIEQIVNRDDLLILLTKEVALLKYEISRKK